MKQFDKEATEKKELKRGNRKEVTESSTAHHWLHLHGNRLVLFAVNLPPFL